MCPIVTPIWFGSASCAWAGTTPSMARARKVRCFIGRLFRNALRSSKHGFRGLFGDLAHAGRRVRPWSPGQARRVTSDLLCPKDQFVVGERYRFLVHVPELEI